MRHAVAPRSARLPEPNQGVGFGLRLPHLLEVATALPEIPWLEVHPENFLANPHAREVLVKLSRHYPVSLHTVGISVGSADGIDRQHLSRICELIEEIDPVLVSGHLAWSSIGGIYLNDLLPVPYDEKSLSIVAAHVQEVQDAISRPYLVENPASYLGFGSSTLAETEFLGELVGLTGCRLLCDVSNIAVSAANLGFDAYAYIDAFPADAIAEFHLGGFTRECDAAGSEVLIDSHAAPIDQEALSLFRYALKRFGARPTLVEWDNSLPGLDTLIAEVERVSAIAVQVFEKTDANVAVG